MKSWLRVDEVSLDNIHFEYRGFSVTTVAFSGIAEKNHIFEWMMSFNKLKTNFIGIRDPDNKWYMTQEEMIMDYFRVLMKSVSDRQLRFIGGSAGGFAALRFGNLLGVKKVLAFSPQSACGEMKRSLGDDRWEEWCKSTPSFDLQGLNLKSAEVHYGTAEKLDVIHARRIEAKKIVYPLVKHDLPRWLKEREMLQEILVKFIA